MATLVSVNGLNIHHRLDGLVLQQDSVSPHYVAGEGSDFAAVGCAGSLGHGDTSNGHVALVIKAGYLHDEQETLFNESHTFDQLSLDELFRGDRLSELLALQCVLEGSFAGACCHADSDPSHKDAGVLKHFFGTGGEVLSKLQTFIVGDKDVI